MPRVRSLTVTEAQDSYNLEAECGNIACFPSLSYLTVSRDAVIHEFATVPLPPLSSFTVYNTPERDMSHITKRTFCLFASGGLCTEREESRDALTRAPRMRQLAFSTGRVYWTASDDDCHIFALGPTLSSPLSNHVYLEFLVGLALIDLADLLSPTSSPGFAAQLTHIALRVHSLERAAAAALPPWLPSIYPSLTHAHVGLQYKPKGERQAECAEWEAAVRTVRAGLGSAWCDDAANVRCHGVRMWCGGAVHGCQYKRCSPGPISLVGVDD